FRESLANPLPRPPEGPVHAFPAIEQAESAWTIGGWVIVALSFVAPVLIRIHNPLHAPVKGEAAGYPFFGGAVFNVDPLSVFTVFLFVSTTILCAAWTITDMLDRRSR